MIFLEGFADLSQILARGDTRAGASIMSSGPSDNGTVPLTAKTVLLTANGIVECPNFLLAIERGRHARDCGSENVSQPSWILHGQADSSTAATDRGPIRQ